HRDRAAAAVLIEDLTARIERIGADAHAADCALHHYVDWRDCAWLNLQASQPRVASAVVGGKESALLLRPVGIGGEDYATRRTRRLKADVNISALDGQAIGRCGCFCCRSG